MKINHLIREARKDKGWDQADLARRMKVSQGTISDWERENGTTPRLDKVRELVSLLGLNIPGFELDVRDKEESFTHNPIVKGNTKPAPAPTWSSVPLRGSVGAAAMFMPFIDDVSEYIQPPMPPHATTEAVRLEGDSMLPVFPSGTTLYYSSRETNIARFLNRTTICGLEDGQVLMKTIRKGGKTGLYTLESVNPDFDDIIDVSVIYVLPIDHIEL